MEKGKLPLKSGGKNMKIGFGFDSVAAEKNHHTTFLMVKYNYNEAG